MLTPEQIAGDSETSQQQALFAWAGLNQKTYPQLKWLHAIPNANSHRMVAEGVRGGIPDVCLPWPKIIADYWWHGMYIEMKTQKRRNQKNGGLSEDQIKFIDYARSVGYQVEVCYGWEQARDRIMEYLNVK